MKHEYIVMINGIGFFAVRLKTIYSDKPKKEKVDLIGNFTEYNTILYHLNIIL